MVQFEAEIDGRWVQVRRYDSSHGYFHVHSKPWDKDADTRSHVQVSDLKQGLDLASNDLKQHWECYRDSCEAEIRGRS